MGTDALYAMTCGNMRALARPCGDAEARAKSMCQRMIYTHRRVSEGHSRNAGGVVHHASRLFIVGMLIGDGQVFEDQLDSLHGVGVGIGRGVSGDSSFQARGSGSRCRYRQ